MIALEPMKDHVHQIGTDHADLIDDDQVGGFEDFFEVAQALFVALIALSQLIKIGRNAKRKEAVDREAVDIDRAHPGRAQGHHLPIRLPIVGDHVIGQVALARPGTAGEEDIAVHEMIEYVLEGR